MTRRIIRGSGLTLAAQVLGAGATAAVGIVLARALGSAGFGEYALALAATTVMAPIADAGISLAVARVVAANPGGDEAAAAVANGLVAKLLTTAVAAAALWLAAGPLADAFGRGELTAVFRAGSLALVGQSLLTFVWSTLIADRIMRRE